MKILTPYSWLKSASFFQLQKSEKVDRSGYQNERNSVAPSKSFIHKVLSLLNFQNSSTFEALFKHMVVVVHFQEFQEHYMENGQKVCLLVLSKSFHQALFRLCVMLGENRVETST